MPAQAPFAPTTTAAPSLQPTTTIMQRQSWTSQTSLLTSVQMQPSSDCTLPGQYSVLAAHNMPSALLDTSPLCAAGSSSDAAVVAAADVPLTPTAHAVPDQAEGPRVDLTLQVGG